MLRNLKFAHALYKVCIALLLKLTGCFAASNVCSIAAIWLALSCSSFFKRHIMFQTDLVNVGVLKFFLHTVSNPLFNKTLNCEARRGLLYNRTDLVSAPSARACERLYSVEIYSVLLNQETLFACC